MDDLTAAVFMNPQVVLHILQYLDIKSLATVRMVSKQIFLELATELFRERSHYRFICTDHEDKYGKKLLKYQVNMYKTIFQNPELFCIYERPITRFKLVMRDASLRRQQRRDLNCAWRQVAPHIEELDLVTHINSADIGIILEKLSKVQSMAMSLVQSTSEEPGTLWTNSCLPVPRNSSLESVTQLALFLHLPRPNIHPSLNLHHLLQKFPNLKYFGCFNCAIDGANRANSNALEIPLQRRVLSYIVDNIESFPALNDLMLGTFDNDPEVIQLASRLPPRVNRFALFFSGQRNVMEIHDFIQSKAPFMTSLHVNLNYMKLTRRGNTIVIPRFYWPPMPALVQLRIFWMDDIKLDFLQDVDKTFPVLEKLVICILKNDVEKCFPSLYRIGDNFLSKVVCGSKRPLVSVKMFKIQCLNDKDYNMMGSHAMSEILATAAKIFPNATNLSEYR